MPLIPFFYPHLLVFSFLSQILEYLVHPIIVVLSFVTGGLLISVYSQGHTNLSKLPAESLSSTNNVLLWLWSKDAGTISFSFSSIDLFIIFDLLDPHATKIIFFAYGF